MEVIFEIGNRGLGQRFLVFFVTRMYQLYQTTMSETLDHIYSLPKAERLRIAMQILLSVQAEEAEAALHLAELEAFQEKLGRGEVGYHSEEAMWKAVKKRLS